MSATIVNAAPMGVLQGIQDLSTRQLLPEAEVLPTHLPKIFFYAQKGPLDPQLVVGDSLTQMYGSASFDVRQPWATHATVLLNTINAQGNSIMGQRVQPADAAPPATIRILLDVLPTLVPIYQRNTDGSIKLDSSGNPVPTSPATTAPGYKVKWVVEAIPLQPDGSSGFNQGVQGPGDQVDPLTQTQSTRYPVWDFVVSSFGAYGNNLALRIWADRKSVV